MVTTPTDQNFRPEPTQSREGGERQISKPPEPHKYENQLASTKGLEEVHKDLRANGTNYTTAVADASINSNNQNGVLTGRQALENANAKDLSSANPKDLQGADLAAFKALYRDNPQALRDAGVIDSKEYDILQNAKDSNGGKVDLNSLSFDKNTGRILDPNQIDCNQCTGVAAFDRQIKGTGDQKVDGEDPKDLEKEKVAKGGKGTTDETSDKRERVTAVAGVDGTGEESEKVANPHKATGGETQPQRQLAKNEGEMYRNGTPPPEQPVMKAARGRDGKAEEQIDTASGGGGKKKDKAVKVGSATETAKAGEDKPAEKFPVVSPNSGNAQLDQSLQKMQEAGWIKAKKDDHGQVVRDAQGRPQWEVGDRFKDENARQRFGEQFNAFLNRPDITPEQKASVVNSTQQLLECNTEKQTAGRQANGQRADASNLVGQERREELATAQLENLSKWNGADQDNSNRCNVAQETNANYFLRPEIAAQRTLNIVENGGWKIPANQSSTGRDQFVPMGDAISRLNSEGNILNNNSGSTNLHSQLDQTALAKQYNQMRGMIYSVGTPTTDNPTGESLTYRDGTAVCDEDGKPVHSPNMTMADVADQAKGKELGMADQVTVVADRSWNNGRSTPNLTVVDRNDPSKLQSVVDGIQNSGQKHYMIMGVAGGDRAVADAQGRRDVAAGAHSGHAIGAAYDPTALARDGRTRGTWMGNNTWGQGMDDVWDKNLVSDDGKIKLDVASRAMDMSLNREGGAPGVPQGDNFKDYREHMEKFPNSDNGTKQRTRELEEAQKKQAKEKQEAEEQRKREQEQKERERKEQEEKEREKNQRPDKKAEDSPEKRSEAVARMGSVSGRMAEAEHHWKEAQRTLDAGTSDSSMANLYQGQYFTLLDQYNTARRDAA